MVINLKGNFYFLLGKFSELNYLMRTIPFSFGLIFTMLH